VLKVRSNKLYGKLKPTKNRALPGREESRSADTEWELMLHGRDTDALYWDLGSTGGWYDLIVTSHDDPSFLRRVAGRVETGRHSVSDPAMGLADNF
jgi:phospholipase C